MWRLILRGKRMVTWCLEQVVIGLTAALVLDVLWGVGTRFVLKSPSRWTEEVATFLLIWVALLGAAVATGRREHLGVDFLVNKLDPAARRLLAIAAQLVVAAFASATLIYGGYVLVSATLAANQLTPALELPMGYVYLAVPASGVFILLFSLEQLAELVTFSVPVSDVASESAAHPDEAI
jgi:TRAP-type C4-dicarboxylate transport system permease small subunit